ncbi:MAG TPA: hypothetical protein VGB45_02930 [Abditibacterium sp.]|jgi:hypothetical protein
MTSFSIKSDNSSDHLSISWKPSRYKFDNAEVEIKAGNFGGKYECEIMSDDMESLLIELRKLYVSLSGTLEFQAMETQLELKITGDGRGHFEAECEAQESWNGSCLIFTLKFDQTHIPRMIRELDEMLS